jgi:hypothetical protein
MGLSWRELAALVVCILAAWYACGLGCLYTPAAWYACGLGRAHLLAKFSAKKNPSDRRGNLGVNYLSDGRYKVSP